MKILVVNIKTYKGKDYLRCDRKSIYGNPFPLLKEEDRFNVVNKYRKWLFSLKDDHPLILNIDRILIPKYKNSEYLKLGCHCAPKLCHCDVLSEFLTLKLNKQLNSSD